jgi:DNA repair exonuclease SbcCD ATPase subunit
MIRFHTVVLKNFLSYGNAPTTFDFTQEGTALIVGENGAGKSSIMNALVYGLYDKPISAISKDDLVNNINKKKLQVDVVFEKDGTFYKITRCRKMKAGASGNFVKLYKRADLNFEDDDEITFDSVTNTNRAIERAIGIPYELFVRIVVFSALHLPFLDLPVRHPTLPCQTGIIEELFGLTVLSEKSEKLKEVIKESKGLIRDTEKDLNHLKVEHDRHISLLQNAEDRVVKWDNNLAEEIVELEKELKELTDTYGVGEWVDGKIHLDTAMVDQLFDMFDKIEAIDSEVKQIVRDIATREKETLKNENKILRLGKEIQQLNDNVCPYCEQEYKDNQTKIDSLEQEIASSEQRVKVLAGEISVLEVNQAKLEKTKAKLDKSINGASRQDLMGVKDDVSEYIKLRVSENPHIEALEELKKIELSPVDYTDLNKMTKDLEHQEFLLKLLTKKDSFVRKVLLNRNLPFLNKRLSEYMQAMDGQFIVEFGDDLTAKITRLGEQISFGNLSTGQKARVNLALSMTFRDILQTLHGKINVCLLDEVLDAGLDDDGVQCAARMLKRKSRKDKISMLIISHRDEVDSAFDRRINVEVVQGFSVIKYDVQDAEAA